LVVSDEAKSTWNNILLEKFNCQLEQFSEITDVVKDNLKKLKITSLKKELHEISAILDKSWFLFECSDF